MAVNEFRIGRRTDLICIQLAVQALAAIGNVTYLPNKPLGKFLLDVDVPLMDRRHLQMLIEDHDIRSHAQQLGRWRQETGRYNIGRSKLGRETPETTARLPEPTHNPA